MAKILIIEDENSLAQGLKFNLESEGYVADIFDNAEDALPVFLDYDMALLDIMLPGMNGLEFLAEVRKSHPKFPVLILSAKSSEGDLLSGLSAGADDYMTKPFSLPELILRVKRIMERQAWYLDAAARESKYSFGDYSIDFDTFEATTNKGAQRLTQHECFVMKYLIENQDRIVTREELLKNVWGYSETTETRTVDAFISRLRKMFEPSPKKPVHIQSIRGQGYRFYP